VTFGDAERLGDGGEEVARGLPILEIEVARLEEALAAEDDARDVAVAVRHAFVGQRPRIDLQLGRRQMDVT
jgi:hypothetical protein